MTWRYTLAPRKRWVGTQPLLLQNTAEGGTNGVIVTPGNSGGASGNAWDEISGSPTFSNQYPSSGTLGYELPSHPTTSHDLRWRGVVDGFTTIPTGIKTLYGRTYLKTVTAWPSIQIEPFLLLTPGLGALIAYSLIDSSGVFTAYSAGGAVGATFQMVLGTQYRIEWKVLSHASAGTIDVFIYLGHSTTPIHTISVTGLNTNGGDIAAVEYECKSLTTTMSAFFDDIGIQTSGFLGPSAFGRYNIAEGGTNGVGVTIANSGDASSDAWDEVTDATSVFFSNDHPSSGGLGYILNGLDDSFPRFFWKDATIPPGITTLYGRVYVFWPMGDWPKYNIFPQWTTSGGASQVGLIGIGPPGTGQLIMRDGLDIDRGTPVQLSKNTLYRIEWKVVSHASAGSIEYRLYRGHSLTLESTEVVSGLNTNGGDIRTLQYSSLKEATMQGTAFLDDIGVQTSGWLGPSGTPAKSLLYPRTDRKVLVAL